MAGPITGVTGNVTPHTDHGLASAIHVTRWNATINRDIHDISSWADNANAKKKIGGMYDLSGSFEGFLDDTTNINNTGASGFQAEDAPPASFVLTSSTGRTLTFSGLLSAIRLSSEKAGVVTVSADFVSSGEVTPA